LLPPSSSVSFGRGEGFGWEGAGAAGALEVWVGAALGAEAGCVLVDAPPPGPEPAPALVLLDDFGRGAGRRAGGATGAESCATETVVRGVFSWTRAADAAGLAPERVTLPTRKASANDAASVVSASAGRLSLGISQARPKDLRRFRVRWGHRACGERS
jgi:hypothetical protein